MYAVNTVNGKINSKKKKRSINSPAHNSSRIEERVVPAGHSALRKLGAKRQAANTVNSTNGINDNSITIVSVVQQNLTDYPPVPILELSTRYILAALEFANHTLKINSTLTANTTQSTNSTQAKRSENTSPNSFSSLARRDDGPETCDGDAPCADGSCCNGDGLCGYGPDYCSTEANCIANCDG
jgi:hypothetical protein